MNADTLRESIASQEAISHHYDLSNDFYALWLDPTMTYTCALWESPDESLERAQQRKIDWHASKAELQGASRILDVGCGWGGLLKRAVDTWGVKHAVGLSLSQEQQAWCKGLGEERLDVRLENWVDHEPATPYDAILSIEAFEAFARPGMSRAEKVETYRAFFERCHHWLAPGGRLSLQTITYGNADPSELDPFIRDTIFPESDLPRLAEIFHASERLFEPIILVNARSDYATTLHRWQRALRSNKDAAIALIGQEKFRDYDIYLRLSRRVFQIGASDLIRVVFRRIDHHSNYLTSPQTR